MDRRNILVVGVMLMLVLILGFFVVNSYVLDNRDEVKYTEPYRTTISGEQVCLPVKDTSGPVTLECAIGLKTDLGKYYALDFNLMSQTVPEIQNGQRFTASGVVTPIENLSSDHWQKYEVEGIFSVTDSVVVEPVRVINEEPETILVPPPIATSTATTSETVTAQCYVGGCSSQLCTSDPDMASDCMFREEYACYQDATCEVQATGECGWTETSTLTSCLASFDS